MLAIDYLHMLVATISQPEWAALESGANVKVSEFNRCTLLEMRELAENPLPEREINSADALQVEHALRDYLAEHLSEAPEAHKWIITASLYLTFIARRPMHPLKRIGAEVVDTDGEPVYVCPFKRPGDNPICDACVSVPAHTS